VIEARYSVLVASAVAGEKVAVVPLTPTLPMTVAPFAATTTVNVVVVNVAAFMVSENVASTVEFTATLAAPLTGNTVVTVGAVVSPGGLAGGASPPPPWQAASESAVNAEIAGKTTARFGLGRRGERMDKRSSRLLRFAPGYRSAIRVQARAAYCQIASRAISRNRLAVLPAGRV
jgi:hypothetical protein